MATLPRIPEWATLTNYPNLGGGNPWESGSSPVRVVPTNSVKQYGNTPDAPAVAQYDNYFKGELADFATFARKQIIGHWGNVNLEGTYFTNPAKVPMPKRASWLSCGYNTIGITDCFFQLGGDGETYSPIQDAAASNTNSHKAYACALASGLAFFGNTGGNNVTILNMNTGTDGEESPPATIDALEWNDMFATPQGTVLMGGKGRFAHRAAGGVWTVVSPAGLGTTADQIEWWFYSSPDCPTPNRVWAMNRCDQFLYSDDGGSTWSTPVTFTVAGGADVIACRPVWDRLNNRWVFATGDMSTYTWKLYTSTDGVNFTGPAGDSDMTLTSLAEFGGVLYGLAILNSGSNPTFCKAIEIVYSLDGGYTWSQTGKVLAFLGNSPGGSFPMSGQFFETHTRINKAPWGLLACAENVNTWLQHTCALKPFVDTFPVL